MGGGAMNEELNEAVARIRLWERRADITIFVAFVLALVTLFADSLLMYVAWALALLAWLICRHEINRAKNDAQRLL